MSTFRTCLAAAPGILATLEAMACTHDFDVFEGNVSDTTPGGGDASTPPGSDGGAADGSSGGDAAPTADASSDGGSCAIAQGCYDQAGICRNACKDTRDACMAACGGGPSGMGCRNKCRNDEDACNAGCSSTCRNCASAACASGCP